MSQGDPSTPVALQLARHAVATRAHPLPAATVMAAQSVFVDWVGVAIAGAFSLPSRVLSDAFASSEGSARLVGTSGHADPMSAALINGTAAHTLELDDIYASGLFHPGAPVVAAALAIADREHVSGQELLRGIVIGYEVGNRVAADLGPAHYEYWHTTGTAGAVAAAAAVSEVIGSDEQRFAHALALSATMASGLQQTFRQDAMGKPLHAGHAAMSGVVAALAAHGGLTGALDIFEGAVGMGAAMGDGTQWTRTQEAFGPAFLVERTTVKPYPCCGHAFAAIDCALSLRESGLSMADVAAIKVRTYSTAVTVAGIVSPQTVAEARFSIPFLVACALRDGGVNLENLSQAALGDGGLTDVVSRVELTVDSEFDEVFPERRGAGIDLVDTDGVVHTHVVKDRSGSPENPMTAEQIESKFIGLVAHVSNQEFAAASLGRAQHLADLTDVGDLLLSCP